MPSTSYTDPRLAALYDRLNPRGPDWEFYLGLAGTGPLRVLDMGCGTGELACLFAAAGHEATGADPAPAMLAIARGRPGGERVTWIEAGATDLATDRRFDLAIMTGHAFQVLRSDAEIGAALATFRRHVVPGGRLAFETRNPEVRAWETWTADDIDVVDLPGHGRVEVGYQTTGVEGELVTYAIRFRFGPDDLVLSHDTLRFIGRERLAALLAEAGFADLAWFGDWDASPVTPASPELIVVAR
jgi:SAM-dependent methyltransferase